MLVPGLLTELDQKNYPATPARDILTLKGFIKKVGPDQPNRGSSFDTLKESRIDIKVK